MLSRAGAAIGALVLLSVPRVPSARARAAAVPAVGSTAVRASGASRWPLSVVLAIGAAAAWPLGAALRRPLPAAAGCRFAARRASLHRSVASAALSVVSPAHWLMHLAVSPTW